MRTVSPNEISQLQKNSSNIRNICILAHVDHGKTTLADSLIASNGIISTRLAGKVRYMDSREDEQVRGITMKSSAISLHYPHSDGGDYLINLIDSPGHVDFSSEVSTAVRLCDGAIIVVDAVEGVCPQTHVVLRQAWLESIRPCLVINKVDRLITELKCSPMEAYVRLQQILEQAISCDMSFLTAVLHFCEHSDPVNALTGELFTVKVMEDSEIVDEKNKKEDKSMMENGENLYDWSIGLEDIDDSSLYFSPDQGNVVFASAIDGWGFRVSDFAAIFSKKIGAKAKKPLFVQVILDNLWNLYNAIYIKKDKIQSENIVKSLNLKVSVRDSRHGDARVYLYAVCSQWLPLSKAVLSMVCDKLPSPCSVSIDRIEKLMGSTSLQGRSLSANVKEIKEVMLHCKSGDNSPVILHVTKMVSVEKNCLPQNKPKTLTMEEIRHRRALAKERLSNRNQQRTEDKRETNVDNANQEPVTTENESDSTTLKVEKNNEDTAESQIKSTKQGDTEALEERNHEFIAFARIFCGTIRRGDKLHILNYGKNNARPYISGKDENVENSSRNDISENMFEVADLYLWMGRQLELLDEVPAGNILGIGNLEKHILKSATISSASNCPPLMPVPFAVVPIVHVAIEPAHFSDIAKLTNGLRLLNQADPCVETLVQESGEHVIVAAGEVHLDRCLKDLRERFAPGVEISVSEPIIPFRETIIPPPQLDMVNELIDSNETQSTTRRQELDYDYPNCEDNAGTITVFTSDKSCKLVVKAKPLPTNVTKLLDESADVIKSIVGSKSVRKDHSLSPVDSELTEVALFYNSLVEEFNVAGEEWKDIVDKIWCFGPRNYGPNILVNEIPSYNRSTLWDVTQDRPVNVEQDMFRKFDNSVITGFQLATLAGPLCEEPMMGVCFVIKEWTYLPSIQSSSEALDNLALESNETRVAKNEISSASEGKGAKSISINSGQLMSAIKSGCRRAFLAQPVRLMVPTYKCTIHATSDVLGKVYAVLGRRNGQILSEDMQEGSSIFNIEAVLPVAESFGFTDEIRKKTSGLANPQLIFNNWEIIPADPFWVPTTEEEILHFGEKADSENRARLLVDKIRARKGLIVQKKIVEHAEKQRTIKK
ncbi:Elongation factor-like GTPase 1 [Trichoplax sp. H2]|nr:Elongation factor-like GTPase 1 [Trichoplax sp. H2]|eukprot:RDD37770.1 Elongation factor-like GTPase 1 [Trichoplax sp. H2]